MRPGRENTSVPIPYRYYILTGLYVLVTGGAFFRVSRQPYNARVKAEQYETIFKGTTLATVLAVLAISGRLNEARSADRMG